MKKDIDFADILVRMPGVVWRYIAKKAADNDRAPIEEIVYRLSSTMDKDVSVEIKTKLIDKSESGDIADKDE